MMNGRKRWSEFFAHLSWQRKQGWKQVFSFPGLRVACLLWLSFVAISCFAQLNKKPLQNFSSTEIYIPLRSREEVKLLPLLDTLEAKKEYKFKLRFSSRYHFSELFFDKGLAVRTDSFLRMVPSTKLTQGFDTATLRIIGFSNNSRILLFHHFLIRAQQKVFPVLNPNKSTYITLNNLALERNEKYKKDNFGDLTKLNYLDNGKFNEDNIITAITVSLVNRDLNKNLYVKADRPTKEMMREIRSMKNGTLCYIRLDIRNGKKAKSSWTRILLVD